MRQSILGFNQSKVIEVGLTMDDLLLLQYIMYANNEPSMSHIVENEIAYVWLNHDKIKEDLPILGITEGTLKNKLCALKTKNLINSKVIANKAEKGTRTYYTITELTISLMNDIKISKSFKNDMKEEPSNSKMTSYNNINNNINNSVLYDRSYNTTTNNVDENLSDFLIKKEDKIYKAENKKENEYNENSRAYKNVVDFINTLNYNQNTKEILFKWYNSVGKGKVSIKMLKDKITRLYENVKTESEAYESFNNSYINSWLAFYPPKRYTNFNKRDTDPMYQEQKQVTEEMKARNADGSLMVF